jgi:xylulokinase
MARLLGIDVGTSGCKVLVIDETGRVLARASARYPVSMPQPLWSEQDPEDWWSGVQACLASGSEIWALAGEDRDDFSVCPLTGIGLTGQMHGAVFLDQNGEVIRPAILWNDQRTTEECEDIDRIVGAERVREITCNPPLTGFQLPKILWLRKHEPENFMRVRRVLLPKDYIRFRLTGEYATEMSDASGTGIFDVRRREWSREMMDALDLDTEFFPRVVESTVQTGVAHTSSPGSATLIRALCDDLLPAAGEEGSPTSPVNARGAPVAVYGGGGDQAAGAVGTGAVHQDVISVSLGTSGVVFSSISEPPSRLRQSAPASQGEMEVVSTQGIIGEDELHTFCHANGEWHVMGVMLGCGGALSWYASNVRHLPVDEVLAEAETTDPGCGGLTFLPYLSGERSPHNDPCARASFSGLNLSHGSKEMSRAVVEGVTFGLRDCFEGLVGGSRLETNRSHSGPKAQASSPEPIVRVTGGGAKSRFWVQMIADVFGCAVETLEADEGPAFGAALIAGVGAGIWPSLQDACEATVRAKERFEPSGVEYQESYERYRALYPHLRSWLKQSRTT